MLICSKLAIWYTYGINLPDVHFTKKKTLNCSKLCLPLKTFWMSYTNFLGRPRPRLDCARLVMEQSIGRPLWRISCAGFDKVAKLPSSCMVESNRFIRWLCRCNFKWNRPLLFHYYVNSISSWGEWGELCSYSLACSTYWMCKETSTKSPIWYWLDVDLYIPQLLSHGRIW